MNISMALVDYIPVFMFLVAVLILQRDLYNKMSKGAFALFSGGTIIIFVAGFFKATWKLLYAANICDFVALNMSFMPMQSAGFVMAAIAMIGFLLCKQGNTVYTVAAPAAVLPAEFKGTMLFVGFMVAGVAVFNLGLAVVAKKRKQMPAVLLYVLSLVLMLCMGYLSSRDFTEPMMNWIGEGVNICGQGVFLLATWMIHKKGLGLADALE